ncbi:hypothetical protein [Trujillonella endophytica]|uniref:Uncharacterized protein n=1 Tax=Trujillonella endophytica TaxID=673521 RepID=A0A1H8VUV4_9ACTN|nr:hypothetical protein [Trujillella endophytica]SEP19171.1 hypothetical protein SAMN05660991_03790 [Trujillella endophytica]
MARHLNDETAEFKMPRPGRHAADDENHEQDDAQQEPEATKRFDPGFRERPRPAPPAPPSSDQR